MCSIAGALCSTAGASCSVAGAVIFSIASGSILTVFFLLHLLRTPSRPPKTPPPCDESYPLIGNLIGLLRNRHRIHDWISDMLSQSPTSTIQVSTFLNLSSGVCTADPLDVEHLLAANFSNYIKGSRYQIVLDELIGGGIFAADGHLWATQRKIASYEFSTNSLKSFVSDTVNSGISDRLIPFLSDACGEDRIIDLQEVLQKFTFDNLCKVAFGIDPRSLSSETLAESSDSVFVRAMDDANEIAFSRFMSPLPALWKIKRFLKIGSEKRFSEAIESINEFAANIIRSKEGKTESDLDLLSRFMASSSNLEFRDGEQRRKFLRDVIISFVLAGKDTTSTALTWFFWIISVHSQSEHRILNELSSSESTPRGIRIFSYDELKQLHYIHAAVTESLRLFPPVPLNSKTAVADDVLPDGTRVGRGWFADYSAYAMGRSEKLWGRDRLEYRPERWLDGAGKFQPPNQFRFPVFHCGPRMCLGKEMAYVQMKSIVAAVMAEFEVVPVAAAAGGGVPEQPTYVLSMQLKMKGGLKVRLRRRNI